jgi:hypothetical protein
VFSRFLLILVAIELITWPLTQYFWTWDHFLHGGQDFESCLLVAVMSLCLVLLLAQHIKHQMDKLLMIRRLFRLLSPDRESARTIPDRRLLILLSERVTSCFLSLNSLPLQI